MSSSPLGWDLGKILEFYIRDGVIWCFLGGIFAIRCLWALATVTSGSLAKRAGRLTKYWLVIHSNVMHNIEMLHAVTIKAESKWNIASQFWSQSTSVLDSYCTLCVEKYYFTPCVSEHGIPDCGERLWQKEGLKTRVENVTRNVSNRSSTTAWSWRRAGWWWWCTRLITNTESIWNTVRVGTLLRRRRSRRNLFHKWGAACDVETEVNWRLEESDQCRRSSEPVKCSNMNSKLCSE